MRQAALLFGVFVLCAAGASAQVESANPPLFASSAPEAAPNVTAPVAASDLATEPASPIGAGSDAIAGSLPEAAGSAAQQVNVTGVFPQYHWQAYAGYTFFRFYAVPGQDHNTNGLDLSLQYFPWAGHLAADGEFMGTFGPGGAKFVAGMGGARGRWAIPLGMEVWGHGLVGESHFLPQTPYGNQSALAYEVGGGLDFGSIHGRFAYRVSADMVGTHFFGTYQYSPKLSVGIIFKY